MPLLSSAAILAFNYNITNADLILFKDGSKTYNHEIIEETFQSVTIKDKEGKNIYIPNEKIKNYIRINHDIDEETATKLEELISMEDWGELKLDLPVSNNFLGYDEHFETYHLIYYCSKLRLPKDYSYLSMEEAPTKEEALKIKKELEAEGFDVYYRTAEAEANSSTISKTLLENTIPRKAYVVLHENMHDHVYFPPSLDEAAAQVAGYFGALDYLSEKYGENSETYKRIKNLINLTLDNDLLTIEYYNKLDKLFNSKVPRSEKITKKKELFDELAKKRSKLLGYETAEENNPSLTSDMTYARLYPLAERVYQKTQSTKAAIKLFKNLSEKLEDIDFPYLKYTENKLKYCIKYLEDYLATPF